MRLSLLALLLFEQKLFLRLPYFVGLKRVVVALGLTNVVGVILEVVVALVYHAVLEVKRVLF